MKKEVILAILIGLSLGLVITFGVYQAKNTLKKPTEQPIVENQPSPSIEDANPNKLVVLSPDDEIIYPDEKINISGTTLADTFVIIFVGNEETIITSDESGNFAAEVDLEEGSNVVTIFSIDEDGQSSKVERTIIVTDQPLEETDLESEDSTQSAQTDEDEEETT